jgi:geranylgeranyl pyrophosphate synthase
MKKFWKSLDWIIPELELVRGIILFSLDSAALPHEQLRETALSLFDPPGKMIRSGMLISAARAVHPQWSDRRMKSPPGWDAPRFKKEISARSADGSHIDESRLSSEVLPGALPLRFYLLAAALEVLHTATLVHDDVLDNADVRRNRPSASARIGNRQAILLGDHLLTLAFQMVSEAAGVTSGRIISRVMGGICRGEMLQNSLMYDLEKGASIRFYRQRITGKTAVMISLALYLGARESAIEADERKHNDNPQDDPEYCRYIRRFGYNTGMAFQVVDDILDLDLKAENGKVKGQDLREGILTLPLLLQLRSGVISKEELTELWSGQPDQGRINEFLSAERVQHGCELASIEAHTYGYRATEALLAAERLSGQSMDILRTISALLLKRRY